MASGVMTIKYGSNAIRNAANRAAREFDDAADRMRNVAKRLDNMEERSRHGYIRTASAFLRKKEQQYNQKQTALENFARCADSFMDDVKQADQRVAKHLEQSYGSFKRITGLKGAGFISTLLKTLAKGVKLLGTLAVFTVLTMHNAATMIGMKVARWIKEWYNNGGKYWIKAAWSVLKCAFTVVAVIGAIVAGGPLAAAVIIGGIMVAIVEFGTAVKDISALVYHCQGKDALAEELSGMEGAAFCGMLLSDATGIDAGFATSIFSWMKTIGSVAMLVGGIGNAAAAAGGGKFSLSSLKKGFSTKLTEGWKKNNAFEIGKALKSTFSGKSFFSAAFWKSDAKPVINAITFGKNVLDLSVFNNHKTVFDFGKDLFKKIVSIVPGGKETINVVESVQVSI